MPATIAGVQVGVRIARDARAVRGQLEPALHDRRDVAEVEPPESCRAEEGEDERGDDGEVEVEPGGRRAGDDDRLAERDDHEELEALGEVRSLHVPGGLREAVAVPAPST